MVSVAVLPRVEFNNDEKEGGKNIVTLLAEKMLQAL